jgi:hypothetical protein
MNADMQYAVPMSYGNSKFSMTSISTACGADSSSESIPSVDDNMFMDMKMQSTQSAPYVASAWQNQNCQPDWNCSNAAGLQNFGHDGRYGAAYPSALDRSDMPSTREPSPEPMMHNSNHYQWNEEYVAEQYQTHGQHFPSQPSIEWNNGAPCGLNQGLVQNPAHGQQLAPRGSVQPVLQRGDMGQPAPAQPYQTVLLVPQNQPVIFVQRDQGANVMQGSNVMYPMNNGGVVPFPIQPVPAPSATHTPSGIPTQCNVPTQAQPKQVSSDSMPDPEQQTQTVSANSKSGTTKNRGYLKNGMAFNKMSPEQKEVLCKYIYDFMVQKKFTSQEGYLIVDVFSEVWKDVGDNGEGWRVAQHRFGNLLRSAPQYFRLFRRGIRVANQCGWFARKGEKMVRLVLDKEK